MVSPGLDRPWRPTEPRSDAWGRHEKGLKWTVTPEELVGASKACQKEPAALAEHRCNHLVARRVPRQSVAPAPLPSSDNECIAPGDGSYSQGPQSVVGVVVVTGFPVQEAGPEVRSPSLYEPGEKAPENVISARSIVLVPWLSEQGGQRSIRHLMSTLRKDAKHLILFQHQRNTKLLEDHIVGQPLGGHRFAAARSALLDDETVEEPHELLVRADDRSVLVVVERQSPGIVRLQSCPTQLENRHQTLIGQRQRVAQTVENFVVFHDAPYAESTLDAPSSGADRRHSWFRPSPSR